MSAICAIIPNILQLRPRGPLSPVARAFLIYLILSASIGVITSANANNELMELQRIPHDWALPNGNYRGTRYSALDQINRHNAHRLRAAWTESTGVLRGHAGGPLVVDGVLYLVTPFPNVVYAFDLDDPGRVLWTYEPRQNPEVIPMMCCDTYSMGLAYADDMIFLYQADTRLVALDANSGAVVWEVLNGEPEAGQTATSVPMVVGDNVLVGIDGDYFGVRGVLAAYDLHSGERKWRAYSTGPDEDTLLDPVRTTHLGRPVGVDSGVSSWSGDQWKTGGGAPKGWISYDPVLDLEHPESRDIGLLTVYRCG